VFWSCFSLRRRTGERSPQTLARGASRQGLGASAQQGKSVAPMYEDPWDSSYACPGEAPTPAWVLRLLGWASKEAFLQASRSEVEKRCRAVRVAVHPDRPKDSAAQELEGRDAQTVNSALDEVLAAHGRKAALQTQEPRWGGASAVYAHPHDLGSDDPPCGVFFTPDPWRPRAEELRHAHTSQGELLGLQAFQR